MKSLYLPVGLIISFIIAWILPEPGSLLKELGLIPWMVVIIFLINGYQTNLSELPKDRSFLYALIIGGFISLIVSPFIGLGVSELLALPAGIALGIIVKSTVPPTLSTCIVMTQITNGYPLWALVMTVILNIVGVFTIPFMLGLTMESAGNITIEPLPLLKTLVLLVLVPFMVGVLAKRVSTVDPKNLILQYLPSTCVITTVWMALSDSNELFQNLEISTLLKIAVAILLIHFSLMILSYLTSIGLKLDPGARLAMLFTISQKTLPVAISVLAALNMPIGEAILACVLFHFLMLFTDSMIAPKLKISGEETSA
ncbi:bile acid:sodium symporter [Neptuniibacter sp.]|uniref:bile acid:sodium symporter n=1 Tax=Neptuniibacter sp. TaxID=1962643 RepID=UPI002613B6DC|nr:bile acid:sodium symporter [Neptuniibacter sp.]MCP4597243.1 bile acid:sodium symporter [Neptuniibacter sp.]